MRRTFSLIMTFVLFTLLAAPITPQGLRQKTEPHVVKVGWETGKYKPTAWGIEQALVQAQIKQNLYPGSFITVEFAPGKYALDSQYIKLRDSVILKFDKNVVFTGRHAKGIFHDDTVAVHSFWDGSPTMVYTQTSNKVLLSHKQSYVTTFNEAARYDSVSTFTQIKAFRTTVTDTGDIPLTIPAEIILAGDNKIYKKNADSTAWEEVSKTPQKIYIVGLNVTIDSNITIETVHTNTIGAIVWTRISAGYYIGTLEGAFPKIKPYTTVFREGVDQYLCVLDLRRQDDDSVIVNINSVNDNSGVDIGGGDCLIIIEVID